MSTVHPGLVVVGRIRSDIRIVTSLNEETWSLLLNKKEIDSSTLATRCSIFFFLTVALGVIITNP